MIAAALAEKKVVVRPWAKWVGGKAQLLPVLLPILLSELEKNPNAKYHEPFLGGGAVFFGLRAAGFNGEAVLSDANGDLIATYAQIAVDVEPLIAGLQACAALHTEEWYYSVRAKAPEDRLSRAIRFIYLNKTCFNGLYRVNGKTGQFNVPIGSFKAPPTICDAENLRACSAALERATVECQDFTIVTQNARSGDVVYMDPPYVPVSKTSNFVGYSKGGFTSKDQAALEHECTKLDRMGVRWILSNADCEETRGLYRKWNIQSVQARRNVNSKGGKRGPVGEIVVTNF